MAWECHSPVYSNGPQPLLSISVETRNAEIYSHHPAPWFQHHHSGAPGRSWRQAPLIGCPFSGSVHIQGAICLSQNVSVAEGKGGINEGSFSLTNIVTQLLVKWVASRTQTTSAKHWCPSKEMWLCHRYNCYITVLFVATRSVNKQLISAPLLPVSSHSYPRGLAPQFLQERIRVIVSEFLSLV